MTISFADLQGVVMCFAEALPLEVYRLAPSSVVNNYRSSGAYNPLFGVIGSIWPVSGESLVYLEQQGLRGSADVEIFTPYDQLIIADDTIQQASDRVVFDGKFYAIIHRADWSRGPLWQYFGAQVRQ